MIDYQLRALDSDPKVKASIRGLPHHPTAEWEFFYPPGADEPRLREALEKAGFKILNAKARRIRMADIDGVTRTVAQHASHYKVPAMNVYRRLDRGHTLRQALGLDAMHQPDPRENAIEQMVVKLVYKGGYVTYDEAVQLRPALGDVRRRMVKLRHVRPDLKEIDINEIPIRTTGKKALLCA